MCRFSASQYGMPPPVLRLESQVWMCAVLTCNAMESFASSMPNMRSLLRAQRISHRGNPSCAGVSSSRGDPRQAVTELRCRFSPALRAQGHLGLHQFDGFPNRLRIAASRTHQAQDDLAAQVESHPVRAALWRPPARSPRVAYPHKLVKCLDRTRLAMPRTIRGNRVLDGVGMMMEPLEDKSAGR